MTRRIIIIDSGNRRWETFDLQGHTDVTATMPALRRVIGPGGLALTGVNIIVGAGIFGLPSIVAAGLGASAVLAYVVCAVLIGLVGLCFAEAGSRVGGAGGLYAYVTVPFGLVVGGGGRYPALVCKWRGRERCGGQSPCRHTRSRCPCARRESATRSAHRQLVRSPCGGERPWSSIWRALECSSRAHKAGASRPARGC